jgi:two-component system, NtrC family, nitrogen regulation sensor histidine kinase NtrY
MSRFEIKIVAALLLIAVIPLVASVILVGQVIRVSSSVAEGQTERLTLPLDRAASAYRDLFAARKQVFKLRGQLLARDPALLSALAPLDRAALSGRLSSVIEDVPELGEIRVLDAEGKTIAICHRRQALSADRSRVLHLTTPLGPDGPSLRLTFFTPRAPFDDFRTLGLVQGAATHLTRLREELATYYRVAFLIIFGAVLVVSTGLGLFIARRTARRVAVLAAATQKVAEGDLETQVHLKARDESGALASSFNEMVSQIRESRERIAYLEKIGAWQEIARRLAHEIKNPLTPIQLAVQQLHSKYGGEDPAFSRMLDDARDIITEEVSGLRRLVQDFSAFAKLPSVQPEPVDVNLLVDDFFKSHSDLEQRARIVWSPITPARHVLVDRMLIKHVLFNLVENAVQAAEETGTLPQLEITLSLSADTLHRRVLLTIEDNGPGMDAETARRVFEPYFTTKEKGTGLGLAIVKKIILEHHGTLSVHSQKGEGTRFLLTLPLVKE